MTVKALHAGTHRHTKGPVQVRAVHKALVPQESQGGPLPPEEVSSTEPAASGQVLLPAEAREGGSSYVNGQGRPRSERRARCTGLTGSESQGLPGNTPLWSHGRSSGLMTCEWPQDVWRLLFCPNLSAEASEGRGVPCSVPGPRGETARRSGAGASVGSGALVPGPRRAANSHGATTLLSVHCPPPLITGSSK